MRPQAAIGRKGVVHRACHVDRHRPGSIDLKNNGGKVALGVSVAVYKIALRVSAVLRSKEGLAGCVFVRALAQKKAREKEKEDRYSHNVGFMQRTLFLV